MPVVVLIHGGAFRMSTKEDENPLPLLEAGYAVAAINYRLGQHAIWPAQIEDCKAAVRWLRAHATNIISMLSILLPMAPQLVAI